MDSKDYLDLHHMIPLSHHCTGKSLLEVLTIALTNPQYDKRLFIDLPFSNSGINKVAMVKNAFLLMSL